VARGFVTLSAKIEGLAEIERRLSAMPVVIQRRILRGALRAGARVFRRHMVQEVPISGERRLDYTGLAPKIPGDLRRSIRVGKPYIDRGRLSITTKAGNDKAFYAHMVEVGVRPHTISRRRNLGRSRNVLVIARQFVSGPVRHPGFAGRFFARSALASGEGPAVLAFRNYFDNRVQQYWATGK